MLSKQFVGSPAKPLGTLFTIATALVLLVTASPVEAKSNYYPYGQCTWGAAELFNQTAPEPGVNWGGNANRWLWNAAAAGWDSRTSPTSVQRGAIICWTGGADGLGHVGYVSQVDWWGWRIQVTEMNWSVKGGWSSTWLPLSNLSRQGKTAMYYFAGFINPVWSPSCKMPRP